MAFLLPSPKACSDSWVPRLLTLTAERWQGLAHQTVSECGSSSCGDVPSDALLPASASQESREVSHIGGSNWRGGELLCGGCPSGSQMRARRAMALDTGRFFVVKPYPAREEEEGIEEELQRLRSLQHPHLAQILGHQRGDGQVLLHMEYLSGGSVATLLAEFGPLSGRLLRQGVRGMLEGLQYLHTREPPIAHGRLRGSNILIDMEIHVKLTDFGCSKFGAGEEGFCASVSALPWLAPEVVRGEAHDLVQADLWSVGCTVIEMATADNPWGSSLKLDEILQALGGCGTLCSAATPRIPADLPPAGRDLVRRCLQTRPAARDCAAELLWHAFVADEAQ